MTEFADLLAVARAAVEIGYRIVRHTPVGHVREKSDRDLVTDIDEAVELAVRDFLVRETPEFGFLGEENGGSPLADGSSSVWTLDPIDGTSNLAHGLPLCAVSLGLVRDGETIVAAMVAPLLELRYHAAKGEGAVGNGRALQVSDVAQLGEAVVSIGDYAVGDDAHAKNEKRLRLTALLAEHVERVRMFGTAALDLAWVAEGRTDATVMLSNKPWDTAAGVLIAREAGAVVIDRIGAPHSFSAAETIAVAPGITSQLTTLLRSI